MTAKPEVIDSLEAPAQVAPLPALRMNISLEAIVYIALIVLALLLRLPNLDTNPLNSTEAHEALAVFRAVHPEAQGSRPVALNPLMFTANTVVMTIGGAENVTARVPTLLVSLFLVAAPLLFRRWLGSARALIMSGLLTLSPVLLVAGRTMAGPVWSMALALGAAWCVSRFVTTRRVTFGVVATVLIVLLAVAAEPAGWLTLIGCLVGLGFALSSMDDPDRAYQNTLRDTILRWPWLQALPIAGLAVIAVGSVFMLYPAGLSTLGESLGAGLRGITNRPAAYPIAYPLLVSLVYEPVFWLFGIAGAYFVFTGNTSREKQFFGRILIGWFIASVLLSLIYAGATPAHALWLTLPLVGLSAIALEKAFSPVRDLFWQVPTWGPWLHGIIVAASLSIAAIHLIVVGRAALGVDPALIPSLQQQDTMKIFMVVLALLLTVITFFLMGSIWGQRGAWHGLAIGLLIIFGLYSFNAGWQAAYIMVDDPRELWHVEPTSRNLNLLVDTVRTASLRATGEPYAIDITIVAPNDDSSLAWALHRFLKIRFVNTISNSLDGPILITPRYVDGDGKDIKPTFGAAYVGQAFAQSSLWPRDSLAYWDYVPWLYNRMTRFTPVPKDYVILWVRSDVYGVVNPSGTPNISSGR